MDLNSRVEVNCGWKDGWTDERIAGRKTERLYRTLLKQVGQKRVATIHLKEKDLHSR